MPDDYNLQRFLDAQDHVYGAVLDELRAGNKSSHWMWFIFPQIKGLGHSGTAQTFAIASLGEAKAYPTCNTLSWVRDSDHVRSLSSM